MPDEADGFLLETQRSAIQSLEILIAEIRRGTVVEFIGMVVGPDDNYRCIGGNTADRHQIAGMLLDLAIKRLQEE